MTTASNTQKSNTTPLVRFRTDDTYCILDINVVFPLPVRLTWKYGPVTQCCAFAMVYGVCIGGANGDDPTGMGRNWLKIKEALKADKGLYKYIVSILKAEHDPRKAIANWYGLGSLVFLNLNCPTKELREFNKWFVKLWKDAWGAEFNVVATGVSRYKTPVSRREYGIDAYIWTNIPFPRPAEEKARIDVDEYEEEGIEWMSEQEAA
jgi:hypothetical protein